MAPINSVSVEVRAEGRRPCREAGAPRGEARSVTQATALRRWSRRFAAVLLAAVLLVAGLWPAPALAQPARAGVVTALEGRATVARPVLAAPAALKFKDEVFVRDRIDTREASIVRVLLGGTALVTVRELSTFTVTEEAGRAVVELQSGRLALTVAKARLRPGESIEVRTPNAIALVRGSLIVAEVGIVAGVPETTFSALRVTVPILVASRTDPAAVISLGVNQAVGIVGPGLAARLTPVVALPPARVRELARAAEAPKPKEHTDKAPEEAQKRVAEKKADEAAQLAALLAEKDEAGGSGAFGESVLAQRVGERTLAVFEVTSKGLLRSFEETLSGLESLAAAEAAFRPFVALSSESASLTSGETFVTCSGPCRSEFSPLVSIVDSKVTQSGAGALVRVDAGASLTLAGNLLEAFGSTISTGGSLLVMSEGASLSSGPGTLGLLHFLELPSDGVTTGAEVVTLGPRVQLTLNRPLFSAVEATIVSGTASTEPRPFIAIGSGARVQALGQIPFVELFSGTLAASGSLLVLGDSATLTDSGSSNFALLNFTGQTFLPTARSRVTTGRGLVELGSGVEVTLNRPLLNGADTVFVSGTASATPQPFIAVGPGARITMTAVQPFMSFGSFFGGASLTATGSLLFLDTGASLTGDRVSTLGLLDFADSSISTTDGGLLELRAGAQLNLRGDQPLLFATSTTFETGRSFLSLAESASLTSEGSSAFALLGFSGGSVATGGHLVALEPGAALRLSENRPLLLGASATLTVGGSFLSLNGGSLTSAGGAEFPLLTLLGGGVTTGAELIALSGSRTDVDAETGLVLGSDRPLQYAGALFTAALAATVNTQKALRIDTALLEASAPLLTLRSGSSLTTSLDAVDLTLKAKISSLGPLVKLDGSTLTVASGALVNVAGGSVLKVTGDLLELASGSTVSVLNGPVLSVSGGSVVTITGALAAFTGSGGNTLSVANSLCPCTTLNGIPVALVNGASATNVSVGATAIKSPGLGVVKLSSGNAALITVSGAASKVTIGGP